MCLLDLICRREHAEPRDYLCQNALSQWQTKLTNLELIFIGLLRRLNGVQSHCKLLALCRYFRHSLRASTFYDASVIIPVVKRCTFELCDLSCVGFLSFAAIIPYDAMQWQSEFHRIITYFVVARI